MPLEKCGWRSLVQIAEGTGFAPNALYGKKPGHLGADLQELIANSQIELRYFGGERGRGGEVMRFRVAGSRNESRSKQIADFDQETSSEIRITKSETANDARKFTEQEQRHLATIMYTDMVGYTALGQRNESLSMALLEEHRKIIRLVLKRHNGREVKTMGDAFLVEFPNALDAVRCAYDVQRTMREFNIALPPEKQFSLRIGLHLGDVIESGGDIFGDAVNIASRVEPLAEDGGICLTRQVYDQVRNKIDLTFESTGEKSLKNIELPVEIYKINLASFEKGKTRNEQIPDTGRVAVLPFANISPDPNESYFADGMTEEVISTISKIPGLTVISRTSIMRYKNSNKSTSEIGKELKVGKILEGSLRKSGNKLRITTQLIDAVTDTHVWSETFDRELEDIFVIQSEIARRVANALQIKLLTEENQQIQREIAGKVASALQTGIRKSGNGGSTGNMEAYTMFLRATQLLHEGTEISCKEAITLFEDAISRDPMFSRAYSGLAEAWVLMGSWWNWADFTLSVDKADVASRRALELEPDSAEAHAVMGSVHQSMDRSDESRLELESALRINPNLAWANENLGVYYATYGKFDNAIKHIEKACYLDPLNPSPMRVLTNILRAERKVDDALEVIRSFKGHDRTHPVVYLQAALCYLQKKDFAKARETLSDGLKVNPDDYWLKVTQGMMHALNGEREAAMDVLRGLMENENESNRINAQAWIRTSLGDLDEAFEAIMKEAEFHSWWFLIKFDPLFENLWNDPRFADFCRKVGLQP